MKKFRIIRGNTWLYLVTFDTPDVSFDWSTVTIRAVLKTQFSDPFSLYDFVITPTYGAGSVAFMLELPGDVCEGLPDSCVGDIRVERVSPKFGPYTPFQFQFEIAPRGVGPL